MKLRVQNGDHLSRDTLILNVGIAVRKTTPLFPKLVSGHFNLLRSFDKFLQVFGHLATPLRPLYRLEPPMFM